jgi:hypothetical protein
LCILDVPLDEADEVIPEPGVGGQREFLELHLVGQVGLEVEVLLVVEEDLAVPVPLELRFHTLDVLLGGEGFGVGLRVEFCCELRVKPVDFAVYEVLGLFVFPEELGVPSTEDHLSVEVVLAIVGEIWVRGFVLLS